MRLRAEHPLFRRRRFFDGRPVAGSDVTDIAWLDADGRPMDERHWRGGAMATTTVFLNGHGIPERDPLSAFPRPKGVKANGPLDTKAHALLVLRCRY